MTNQAHQACTRTTQADTHTACSRRPPPPCPPAAPLPPPRRPPPPPSPAAPAAPISNPPCLCSPFPWHPVISFRRVASILMAIPRPTASTTTSREDWSEGRPPTRRARRRRAGEAHPVTQGTPHSLSVGVGARPAARPLHSPPGAPRRTPACRPRAQAASPRHTAGGHRQRLRCRLRLRPETILHTPADGSPSQSPSDRLCETASSFGMCGAAAQLTPSRVLCSRHRTPMP